MTQEEFNQMQLEAANSEAMKLTDSAIDTLKSAINEIERYKKWAESGNTSHEELLNFTIHYLASNVLGNTRMDLMASCMAKIATLKAAQK